MELLNEISAFLSEKGIAHDTETAFGHSVVVAHKHDGRDIHIIPASISADTPEDAARYAGTLHACSGTIMAKTGARPFTITQDRWERQKEMMKSRLLAHLEIFDQIYARNCEVRKIDKKTAGDFLAVNHSYGDAACRHRYGLYLKRHTGHNAGSDKLQPGTLVAVATFSNARKWIKEDKTIRSYEWTRYASLPGVRLSGGMGKLLRTFIEDVEPDDIMTYADLEWSDGKVYEALGFTLEGRKAPVMFAIDTTCWSRKAIMSEGPSCCRYFQNSGSNKYRLKLTDYQ